MRLKYLLPCFLIGALLVTGCSGWTPKRPEMNEMVISAEDARKFQGNTKLSHNIVVTEVLGGKETGAWSGSNIGNKEFKGALIQSLKAAQFLSTSKTGKYGLSANLIYVAKPIMALDITVTTVAKYILVDTTTNKEIYNKIIRESHTRTLENSPKNGRVRMKLAHEGSAKKNIMKLISELHQIK